MILKGIGSVKVVFPLKDATGIYRKIGSEGEEQFMGQNEEVPQKVFFKCLGCIFML